MDRLFRKIYRIHRKRLKYVNENRRKLLVTFAGVPGSGKTVIARRLEKELRGIRINSIDVEKAYVALGNERDISVKRAYIDWLMNKIVKEFKNKTIILDKGIERTHEEILKWVEENNYEIFVIGLDCSRETLERRIKEREGDNAKYYLAEMDRWVREYKKYKRLNISDIEINTEEGNINEWVKEILNGMAEKY